MRIGLYISSAPTPPLEGLIERAQRAEAAGLHTAWVSHLYDFDALTLAAILGLPLLLPQLILATRMTTGALQGTPWSMLGEIPLFLAALSAGTSVMACILFPYIWRA